MSSCLLEHHAATNERAMRKSPCGNLLTCPAAKSDKSQSTLPLGLLAKRSIPATLAVTPGLRLQAADHSLGEVG